MPEGPSLVILREQTAAFAGRTIARVEGNTSIDKNRLVGQRIVALRTWGKHFLVEMPTFSLRIHFLLFGSYRINERKDAVPRLSLQFDGGDEINVYTCSVKFIEEPLDQVYDWQADVMEREQAAQAQAETHRLAARAASADFERTRRDLEARRVRASNELRKALLAPVSCPAGGSLADVRIPAGVVRGLRDSGADPVEPGAAASGPRR